MYVEPYLFLDGRCEEALEFYKKAIGAEVTALIRFKDSPDPTMVHGGADPNKILHAVFRVGETAIMTSDGRNQGKPEFPGLCAVHRGQDRGRDEEALQRACRGRPCGDAADQDVLQPELRHGRRSFRHHVDDSCADHVINVQPNRREPCSGTRI